MEISSKKLGKVSGKAAKKLAKNALKNPSRFLEIGANVATAAVSKNPKAVLSALPEVINFYHTGEGLYLGKFVTTKIKVCIHDYKYPYSRYT